MSKQNANSKVNDECVLNNIKEVIASNYISDWTPQHISVKKHQFSSSSSRNPQKPLSVNELLFVAQQPRAETYQKSFDSLKEDINVDNFEETIDFDTISNELLDICDGKSRKLIEEIISGYEKNEEKPKKADGLSFESTCILPQDETTITDITFKSETPSSTPMQLETVQQHQIELTNSPIMLDPEEDDQTPTVVEFQKLFTALINQNQELRQTQAEALKRETKLKEDLTEHQKKLEVKLSDIQGILHQLVESGPICDSPVVHSPAKRRNEKRKPKQKFKSKSRVKSPIRFTVSKANEETPRKQKFKSTRSVNKKKPHIKKIKPVKSKTKRKRRKHYPDHEFTFHEKYLGKIPTVITIDLSELDDFDDLSPV